METITAKKIINKTQHNVNVFNDVGDVILIIPPDPTPIRLSEVETSAGDLIADNISIPLTRKSFGQVQGLPDPQDGVFFIVSQLVKSAFPNRTDLLVPSGIVRDSEGKIVGCKSFSC